MDRASLGLDKRVGDWALVRLDTIDSTFREAFEQHRESFLAVLSHSFNSYHGDDYHLRRIVEGRSILYLAATRPGVVGASYVKRNSRRGGTAVFPPEYRSRGIAQSLIRASFEDFPSQYSILDAANAPMLRLLQSVGFTRAETTDEVRDTAPDDFPKLSDFSVASTGLTFSRLSDTRGMRREKLLLMYRTGHADIR
jgi:hypothetical protein